MSTPARILHLNHVAYLGGAEIALINLLTDLDRGDFTPVVCAPIGQLQHELAQTLRVCYASIPPLPGLNRYTLPRFLRRLPRLIVTIARQQPDLIYANTNVAALYAGLIGTWLKRPSLAHIRDIEPLGRMGRALIRRNTRLIAISDAVRQFLLTEGMAAAQMTRVYDGVDLRQYQPPRGDPDRPIIGIFGQLGQRKGHLVLLEALRGLIQAQPQLELWIVGQEPAHSTEHYTEHLRQFIAQHGLTSHVRFFGFRSDIPDLLAQLEVLVLPSLQEPFGKIVIEAMAMAKPVVAARVGGVPEIVEDGRTGRLVPPNEPAALRDALAALLADAPLRRTMGLAGRQRVEQLFSLRRNVQETETIFRELLANPRQW